MDWTALTGSGRTGRIVERDVRAAIQTPKAAQPAIAQSSPAQPEPAMRAPLSPTRRVIAQRMAESIHTAAPVTLTTEVDASELVKLREQLKQARGGSPAPAPSYTALFVKLCAQALHEHPAMNARLEGDELVTEAAAHIGMAVDTPRGLLVPVVRDVQDKTLLRVASEVESLAARARDGRCAPDELRGGTFTITNLGMHDVDAFTPIINLPECAVLGVGRAVLKQVVLDEDGHTAVRRMMWLSLTFDHRLVDGAPAARFLRRVKQLAEQPYLWLVT